MGLIISKKYRLAIDQYFPEPQEKRAIVLHHTVSATVRSVFDWWQNDAYTDGHPRKIGTAFVIEKNGEVFELFAPDCWAHHLGSRHPFNREANQKSIGIELVNEGGLIERQGRWFWFSGHASFAGEVHTLRQPWRGYHAFAAYPAAQIDALTLLVRELCAGFNIPRVLPPKPLEYSLEFLAFHGIYSHCNVRADKTDVHCGFPFAEFYQNIQQEGNHG